MDVYTTYINYVMYLFPLYIDSLILNVHPWLLPAGCDHWLAGKGVGVWTPAS